MSSGAVNKIDIQARIYKMKTELYNNTHHDKSGDWHDGSHDALNKILQMLDEYSR